MGWCPVCVPHAWRVTYAVFNVVWHAFLYTDRRKSAVHHFKQALSIDPLFWAAYEELCVLAVLKYHPLFLVNPLFLLLTIQKQQQRQPPPHALTFQTCVASTEDHNQVSAKSLGDASPRQLKSVHSSAKDASASYQGAIALSAAVKQPLNCAPSSLSFYNNPPMASQLSGIAPPPVRHVQQNTASASSDNSPRSIVNTALQAPQRKFVDEGKLRKISGRLFSVSGPRRSTRLSGEKGSTGTAASSSTGNGTNHSIKYIGNSRLSNAGLRSVAIRKGLTWASENVEEGTRHEGLDDSCLHAQASINTSSSCDAGSTDQDGGSMSLCRTTS